MFREEEEVSSPEINFATPLPPPMSNADSEICAESLFPATLASLTSDLKKAGVRMGMVFSVVGFACLTGPPLAGALIQKRQGSYLYAQIFAGSVMMGGCITLMASRVSRNGWKRARV